ncbi:MAG: hypothetical protein HQL57_06440 [Magnetococcales bacterium]|nr:hypothetical protein [Magnetococcales bacterium]
MPSLNSARFKEETFERSQSHCPEANTGEASDGPKRHGCIYQDLPQGRPFLFRASHDNDVLPDILTHGKFRDKTTGIGYVATSTKIQFFFTHNLADLDPESGELLPLSHFCQHPEYADGSCLDRPCLVTKNGWRSAWEIDKGDVTDDTEDGSVRVSWSFPMVPENDERTDREEEDLLGEWMTECVGD